MSFDLKLTRGDIELSGGAPVVVQNKDKLLQDVLKILFTATGENSLHPWYGTPLLSRAVGQTSNSDILRTEVMDAINFGLGNLKTLQQMQQQDNQFVTPQEMILKVANVDVQLNELDSRKLVVSISLIARSNELVKESFIVKA